MPKETLRIDSQILEPWREIAGILGVSLNEYVEEYIRFRSDEIQNGGLPLIAAEVEHKAYRRREQAEAIAERFEAFAIEKQLEGSRANLGTIASRIEPTPDGYWTIKTDYLSPNGKRWRSQSVYEVTMRATNGKPRRHDFDRPRGGTAGNSALSFWDHAHTEFC